MRRFRTYYKHIGYFNDYESIQDMCSIGPAPSNTFHFSGMMALEMFTKGEGHFIEDTDPDKDDMLSFEDEGECFISLDKKYVITNSVYEGIFDVDVNAEDYDPNMVDCDCYVDVWVFDHIEPYITLEYLKEMVFAKDSITIGMSFNPAVTTKATSWHEFKRKDYHNLNEWAAHVYREFCFQLNRDDVYYIDLVTHRSEILYQS